MHLRSIKEAEMYKKTNHQFRFSDFNQPMGLKLSPENRWVKKAETIPWDAIEDRYAKLFPSKTGMPAKPLRMALGALLIQKQLGCSDRELCEELKENPYMQYFVGLPGFQQNAPFVPSLLVEFRKRLTEKILGEINEMIIEFNTEDDDRDDDGNNKGTLILDATCAPQNIEFPQDINLLNQARQNLEAIVDSICETNGLRKPRMYRKVARKNHLRIAKCRKKTAKKLRGAIKQQLQYVRRDLRYIDGFIDAGYLPTERQQDRIDVIRTLYKQQRQMYDERTHSIADRIVSISQPYVRPIVRGKAAAPTEFGAKLDMSIDERGLCRIEKLSFDAYNESEVLQIATEHYKERTGHYPAKILVDKIYRNRGNLSYCKERGISILGPALGRPKRLSKEALKAEYQDNIDRIEVERGFSLAKRCYGLGRIYTKREDTSRSSIVLSIIAMNVEKLTAFLRNILMIIFSRFAQHRGAEVYIQNGSCVRC